MQSKTFVLLAAALMALPTSLAAPGQCKPVPTPKPGHLTCNGDMYCCSKGLQGNVGYYCGDGPIIKEDQCTMITVCCAKDAKKDLTPRGYTYTGCTMPGTSY